MTPAPRVLVLSGAGCSASSGSPTFRDDGGYWRDHPLLRMARVSRPEDLCTPELFASRPRVAWAFYLWRLELSLRQRPHAGMVAIEGLRRDGWDVRHETTNTDGLWLRAGVPGSLLLERHGELRRSGCPRCGLVFSTPRTRVCTETFELQGEVPSCGRCGSSALPNIVLFGSNPAYSARASRRRAQTLGPWEDAGLRRGSLLVVEVGAGDTVATLRYRSRQLGREGARVIRVNPGADEVRPEGGLLLQEQADTGLTRVAELVRRHAA